MREGKRERDRGETEIEGYKERDDKEIQTLTIKGCCAKFSFVCVSMCWLACEYQLSSAAIGR